MDNQFKDVPKIKAVKPLENNSNKKKIHPNLIQSPYCALCVAPRQCGKSTLLSWLYLHPDGFGQDYYSRVIIFSPSIESDDTSRFLRERYETDTQYTDDKLKAIIEHQKSFAKRDMPDICLIFDDVIGDASMKRNSLLTAFITKARHFNADVFISIQSMKCVPRIVRSNVTDLLVGFPIPNKGMLDDLASEYGEVLPNGSKQWLELYREATRNERYRFMYNKLKSNPIEIFTDFETKIYPKNNE